MTILLTKRETVSPLDRFSRILEKKYNIQLDYFEARQPHIVPVWWIAPFTYIAKSAEVAIK